jgi:ferrous iron transport protein B
VWIARDYTLSGEADLVVNLVDTSHLELSLYLTTQLLEMRVPVVAVLNIMEEDESHRAKVINVEALEHRLGCPVRAVMASKPRDVDELKAELPQLARERSLPRFTIEYPPAIEAAVSDLSRLINETPRTANFDDRWLAVRLLERDAFAARQVAPAVVQAREQHAGHIAQVTGEEADVHIAISRYRLVHALAGETLRKDVPVGECLSTRIDSIVLDRVLGIPIFLGVMYCLFWFTIEFARVFKPFLTQLSDIFFIEGFRQVLGALHFPTWLTTLLADGLGNGFLQVVNFIPIIGFLYLFLAVLEESGYMARANFVMDRLMQSLGLPGNAFVPMVVGFGCNVPSIMATRTLERPRDRIVAVLMSPFMICGGRLAVYTIFAAAFFPDYGQFVVFGIYVLGIIFAMITTLVLKHSLLPEERLLYALELPSYHLPKLGNLLISAWIRVKGFVFRVGKFVIPLVLVLQALSMWGTDGSFRPQAIDHSMLAAGGKAITPALGPMGIHEGQWPATVALLTGVLHKVVIVSALDSIYMESSDKPPQRFDLIERIKQAASTIPENLKTLIGLGSPAPVHQLHGGLAPDLASHFDGTVGALAYLILLLCYPCIATTSATTRETSQRWTAIMVFWTVSLGYGMAVLFYQIGTFFAHPASSAAWIFGVVAYFALMGAAAVEFAPLNASAYPLRLRGTRQQAQPADDQLYRLVPSWWSVGWPIVGTLAVVSVGAMLIAYGPKSMPPGQTEPTAVEVPQPIRTQRSRLASSSQDPTATVEYRAVAALPPEGDAMFKTTSEPSSVSSERTFSRIGELEASDPVEAKLLAFLEGQETSAPELVWFDFANLQFDTRKATLQPSSQAQLHRIARMLSAYPNAKAIIAGHTDNIGNSGRNKRLSQARAETVLRELTRIGVDASRLEARGYADERPVASNDTKAGRAKNRRISLGLMRQ